MALLSDILHGLHFHSSIVLKLQSENVGTYVHFMFILIQVFVKSLVIGRLSNCKVLQITRKESYQNL